VAWAGRSRSAFAICFGALPRSLISRTRTSSCSSRVVTVAVCHFRVAPCEAQGAPAVLPFGVRALPDTKRYGQVSMGGAVGGTVEQVRPLVGWAGTGRKLTHKYAIDAVLAVTARQRKGQVTIFTSDVDDLEKLVPDTIVVRKV
jgi:hypothetical protein